MGFTSTYGDAGGGLHAYYIAENNQYIDAMIYQRNRCAEEWPRAGPDLQNGRRNHIYTLNILIPGRRMLTRICGISGIRAGPGNHETVSEENVTEDFRQECLHACRQNTYVQDACTPITGRFSCTMPWPRHQAHIEPQTGPAPGNQCLMMRAVHIKICAVQPMKYGSGAAWLGWT
ncbi:MAG: hypothetical protein ACLUOI_05455 [Eisenbergiella sp.]